MAGGYAIDPELADLAALMADVPPLTDAVEARDRITSFIGDLNANVDVSTLTVDDREVPGPDSAPPVPVRVYAPAERDGTALPAILYIHGGGFFSGSVESEHGNAAGLARDLGVVVVSVEYRLAPEHPFPAGLDDCDAALQWLAASADDLGVDRERIAVNGGSAGVAWRRRWRSWPVTGVGRRCASSSSASPSSTTASRRRACSGSSTPRCGRARRR